jgi:hypothetical protein
MIISGINCGNWCVARLQGFGHHAEGDIGHQGIQRRRNRAHVGIFERLDIQRHLADGSHVFQIAYIGDP